MTTSEDITKLNLYKLLGILEFSDASIVRKAYHKQALTCHPDKNPDDPKAAERFREYKQACSILLDESARSAYDKVLKASLFHAQRYKEQQSKRQRLLDKLEEGERNAHLFGERESEVDAQIRLQEHVERIRREGSKLLDEENQKLNMQLNAERSRLANAAGQHHHGIASGGASKHRSFHDNDPYSTYRQSTSNRVMKSSVRRGTINQNKLEAAMSDEEYENLVLTKLRQAQQLKRLSLNAEQ